jgi:hypothetical protein
MHKKHELEYALAVDRTLSSDEKDQVRALIHRDETWAIESIRTYTEVLAKGLQFNVQMAASNALIKQRNREAGVNVAFSAAGACLALKAGQPAVAANVAIKGFTSFYNTIVKNEQEKINLISRVLDMPPEQTASLSLLNTDELDQLVAKTIEKVIVQQAAAAETAAAAKAAAEAAAKAAAKAAAAEAAAETAAARTARAKAAAKAAAQAARAKTSKAAAPAAEEDEEDEEEEEHEEEEKQELPEDEEVSPAALAAALEQSRIDKKNMGGRSRRRNKRTKKMGGRKRGRTNRKRC